METGRERLIIQNHILELWQSQDVNLILPVFKACALCMVLGSLSSVKLEWMISKILLNLKTFPDPTQLDAAPSEMQSEYSILCLDLSLGTHSLFCIVSLCTYLPFPCILLIYHWPKVWERVCTWWKDDHLKMPCFEKIIIDYIKVCKCGKVNVI